MSEYKSKDLRLKYILRATKEDQIENQKRIHRKAKFIKRRIAVATTLGLLTFGSVKAVNAVNRAIDEYDEYGYIANVIDLPDDEFENEVPFDVGKKEKQSLENNSIVFMKKEKIKNKDNDVLYINDEGKVVKGTIDGKYLNQID